MIRRPITASDRRSGAQRFGRNAPSQEAGQARVVIMVVILGVAGVIVWLALTGGGEARSVLDQLAKLERTEQPQTVQAFIDNRLAAVEANPNSSQVWGELGEAFDAHEMYAHAAICYERARELAPAEFTWAYLLAVVLDYRGGDEGAIRQAFKDATALAGEFPPVFFRQGEALARLGEYDAARAAQARAVELDPELAIARRALGQILLQLGHVNEAVVELERVHEAHPDDRPLRASLARAYQMAGRAEDAIECAQGLERLGPTISLPDPVRKPVADQALTGERFAAIGAEHLAAGRRDEAIAAFEKSVQLDPNESHTHLQLGSLYLSSNRAADAARHLSRALELDDQLAGAHVGLGIIDLASQRPEAAIERLRQALAINPDAGPAHARLATALAMTGATEDALTHFAEAERLGAMDAQTYRNWGTALEQIQDISGAVQRYSDATRLAPRYIPARYRLARLLESLGRRDDAIAEYRAIAEIDPNHPGAARYRQLTGG